MRCERCGCVGVDRRQKLLGHEMARCAMLSVAFVVPGVVYAMRRVGKPYCVRCKVRVIGNGVSSRDRDENETARPVEVDVIDNTFETADVTTRRATITVEETTIETEELCATTVATTHVETTVKMRIPMAVRPIRAARGFTLLVTAISATCVIGILALCTDFSLKFLVDGELQRTADAAAIAGAQRLLGDTSIPNPSAATVTAEAQSVLLANGSTGGTNQYQAGDIQIGYWDKDARTFTPEANMDDANAVRTTVMRTAARNNGIQTSVAPLVGLGNLQSTRSSIARLESVPDFGLIGGDGITSSGILSVTGSGGSGTGNVASNGDVKINILGLIGITYIDGEVETSGAVQGPSIGILTKITQGTKHPKHPFILPLVTTTKVDATNNNNLLGSALDGSGNLNAVGILDLYAGTYSVNNLNIIIGAIIRVHGPVTIYVKGTTTVLGSILCFNNDASQFKIRVKGSGAVNIAANLTLAADIYAPESTASIAVGVIYYGRLIGRQVNVLGTSFFILQTGLPQPEIGRERASLVR